jgi:hypothetical protein
MDIAASVTTRNDIFTQLIRMPLIVPITKPRTSGTSRATMNGAPCSRAMPSPIPQAVVTDATDRSKPPEMITNVAPTARTRTTELLATMLQMLSQVRKTDWVRVR